MSEQDQKQAVNVSENQKWIVNMSEQDQKLVIKMSEQDQKQAVNVSENQKWVVNVSEQDQKQVNMSQQEQKQIFNVRRHWTGLVQCSMLTCLIKVLALLVPEEQGTFRSATMQERLPRQQKILHASISFIQQC